MKDLANPSILTILLLLIYASTIFAQTSKFEIKFNSVAVSRCHDGNNQFDQYDSTLFSSIYGELIISNVSDTDQAFWMMSCSWTDFVKVRPSFIVLSVPACDGNRPQKITIPKDGRLVLNSIIQVPVDFFNASLDNTYKNVSTPRDEDFITFKIGFLIVEENDYGFPDNYGYEEWMRLHERLNEDHNLIWTPPIKIEYCNYDWHIE